MSGTGSVLVVDLTARSTRVDDVSTAGSLGLGGKALGIRLLEKYLGVHAKPLDPGNVVVLTPSPMAAYGMPGSGRFGAFTRSPLTGIWLESYCGGTFARTLRETQWGAVVMMGAADSPVRIHITSAGASVLPADDLWGADTFAGESRLLDSLDKRSAVLCIGVAGENLVKVANVMHEQPHTLGRGGMGAVLGSKRVKAITVTSGDPLKPAASAEFETTRREVSKLAVEAPVARNYRRFGTPMMVAIVNEVGAFPGDFFTEGTVPHRRALEAETWPEWATIESDTCPPCPMRCRKRLVVSAGPEAGRELHGPEYETLYVFGGSCMVRHALDVARLNEHCNRLGLDTMSVGNLAGLAIKARELGLPQSSPGPGETAAIAVLLEEIARRSTALGDLLAEGMDRAARALGMSDWSVTSKGLDPAGYDPRRLKGMALSYAVSVRGACHLRATFYKPELGGVLEGLDDDAYVATYIDFEDRMILLDSLTMRRFYRDFMGWDNIRSAVGQLNGSPVSKEELQGFCSDVATRIRRLNFGFGLAPAHDTVAERFFREPTGSAPALDREELAGRIRRYWLKRGWAEDGWITG